MSLQQSKPFTGKSEEDHGGSRKYKLETKAENVKSTLKVSRTKQINWKLKQPASAVFSAGPGDPKTSATGGRHSGPSSARGAG